ncbi:MAG: TldD/PmbA family protein [Myxococcales bacterium]|nr:TldD/PmbA family protein [Myxococcales bacterium]
MTAHTDDPMELASRVVDRAMAAGADVAEVSVGEGRHLTAQVRLGEKEVLEEAGSRGLSLRVMRGQQVAVASTSDFREVGLARVVEDALELAALSQADPFAGAPDRELLSEARQHAELDLHDPRVEAIDGAQALEMAMEAEGAALALDKRIGNSDGASVTRQAGSSVLVTSGGFKGSQSGTYISIVVNPVAADGDGKMRAGYHFNARRHVADLLEPRAVGEEAAVRTLAKLGARKLETQQMPVIFDPQSGRAILGLLAGCITGGAIWRKSSYLAERMGTQVASPLVSIEDDPLIARAPGSRAFDGEGLLSRRNTVVDAGQLRCFLLDSYSGRKLEQSSTASASRGGGRVGASTSNFFMKAGALSPEELVASTERALYVTEMMGFGFNGVTGDFSRGAAGFLIEGGKRVHPVSEVTISLNLDDLFARIDAVANDLDHETAICTPTFRVSEMTVAGK